MFRIVITSVFLVFLSSFSAQENLKVMFYNILKFPQSAPDRADTLKNIIQHTQPDILVVNELLSSFGANLVMTKALNVDGVTYYSQAVFQDANGTDTDNHLFYNANKLGLKEQSNINANTRAISEYVMYYKNPNLEPTDDTTFLYVYGCHLKAGDADDVSTGGGNTLTNGERRAAATQSLKNYLSNNGRTKNIIVGGDMNIYSNTETCYSNLLNTGTPLFDPINQAGTWHNSFNYRGLHTQSTRAVGDQLYGGGSGGGLDDRFDMILVSNDIMNGTSGAKYLTNSYRAVGQDGNKFNDAVNDGFNSDVPQDVANSLFYMSDHLPVMLQVQVGGPLSIQREEELILNFNYNSTNGLLNIELDKEYRNLDLNIYSISGQLLTSKKYQNSNSIVDYFNTMSRGIYLVNIIADEIPVSAKISVN